MATSTTRKQEQRLANLRRLVYETYDGPADFCKKFGLSTQRVYLVSMIGPNPSRPISDGMAQKIEEAMGMQPGDLDLPMADASVGHADGKAAPARAASTDEGLTADIDRMMLLINTVRRVSDKNELALSTDKTTELVKYLFKEAARTGVVPTEDQIEILVKLLK